MVAQRREHRSAAQTALFEHRLERRQSLAKRSALEIFGASCVGFLLQALDVVPSIGHRGVKHLAIFVADEMPAAGNEADGAISQAVRAVHAAADEDGKAVASAGELQELGQTMAVLRGVLDGDDVWMSAK